MKVKDLKEKLIYYCVPERLYCLNGDLKEDANCLIQTSKGWEVFYVERGEKNLIVQFQYEFQAVNYLWGIVINKLEQDYGAEIIITFKVI